MTMDKKESIGFVVDVETTGLQYDSQVIEVGGLFTRFDSDNGNLVEVSEPTSIRCKPTKDIELGASIVTGIYAEDLINKKPHNEVVPMFMDKQFDYLIGHNISFDTKTMANSGFVNTAKVICTLSLSRYLYPKAKSHTLLYMLHLLDYDYIRNSNKQAHTAKGDTYYCYRLLQIICREHAIKNLDELYALSEQSLIPVYVPFGRNKGKLLTEVLANEKEWLLQKADDPYLKSRLLELIEYDKNNDTNLPVIMPFGKYQGEAINGISDAYKEYMVNQLEPSFVRRSLQLSLEGKLEDGHLTETQAKSNADDDKCDKQEFDSSIDKLDAIERVHAARDAIYLREYDSSRQNSPSSTGA